MTMNFCTKCGNQLAPGLQFCTHCGAPVVSASRPPDEDAPAPSPPPAAALPAAEAIPEPPAASEWQAMPAAAVSSSVPAASQPAASSKSGCLPAILITLAVLAVIAVLVVGGVVYAGYKLKQKATALLHETTSAAQPASSPNQSKPGSPASTASDSPAGLLGNLTNMLGGDDDDGDLVQSVSDKDPVSPCIPAPFPAQSSARIPLQAGTVITTAWGIKYQDVESRIRLEAGTPVSIVMTNATDAFKVDDGSEAKAANYTDTVCNADFASAGVYMTVVGPHMPHLIHGVTRLRLSDKSFNEVKSTGKTYLEYLDFLRSGEAEKPTHDGGMLTRVEPDDVPYPMIVNDERVTLPVIHLAGIFDSVGKDPTPKKFRPNHAAADLYFIDDPLNPLVLLWREKDPALHDGKFRIEVVKIDYAAPHPVNLVEKQLTEQKRAVTYGIYFDFNKDTIKPESEPVLKQIVQAMTDNPTWKLTVEGHTDNIGGDAYNLDLSKRRAAAVKQALVTRYHIAADRLSTNGFGSSSPVDTNDTLEGRARNRRVELTRE
jgi:outer membrane protein OmpA-like peptidoglycan-associated protein